MGNVRNGLFRGFYQRVEVYEVTPTYYASGQIERTFSLSGSGFLGIPPDAIGVLSNSNDDPLIWLYQAGGFRFATVNVIDDRQMIVDNEEHAISANVYLGAIVSADKQTIYWRNDSKPLP